MGLKTENRSSPTPIGIVALYDADDERCADMLEAQLLPSVHSNALSFWHLRHIRPGDDAETSIREALHAAEIVVLFVAPNFNRRYLQQFDAVLRPDGNAYRHQVVPVYTRPCNWRSMPFGHLQCLPRNGDPLVREGSISEQEVKTLADELVLLASSERAKPPTNTTLVPQTTPFTTSLVAQMKQMILLDNSRNDQLTQLIDGGLPGSDTRNWFGTTQETYRILTLGVSGAGKTALTLRWANPLTDFATLRATRFERYQRTTSRTVTDGVVVEHVFQISDWGGEYIVDAQQELITQGVDAIVLVVDLGPFGAQAVERSRVEHQLREFQPGVLKFILTPKTLGTIKTVALFINKCDLLSGTAPEVDRQARSHYAQLIDSLETYRDRTDVATFAGSAIYGHSTHALFAHLIRKILPPSAYDLELRQGTKVE